MLEKDGQMECNPANCTAARIMPKETKLHRAISYTIHNKMSKASDTSEHYGVSITDNMTFSRYTATVYIMMHTQPLKPPQAHKLKRIDHDAQRLNSQHLSTIRYMNSRHVLATTNPQKWRTGCPNQPPYIRLSRNNVDSLMVPTTNVHFPLPHSILAMLSFKAKH